MMQQVFERYEKKYLVTRRQYGPLIRQLLEKMQPDQYGKHLISNIYLDTPDYQLIRASLEKPLYKEKIRLRSYGCPKDEDMVFLELKKKFDGIVYKRRVEMTLADARKYLWYGIRPGIESQVFREIDYAYQFYQAKPMVYLAYERIAFFDREDPELRVTFDMNVRARDCFLELGKDTYGEQLLKPGQYLMEVKIPGAMPVWMSRMLSELSIYPVSFSKYGAYYQEFLADRNPEGVRNCA